jgi:hypothetical protein
MLYSTTCVMDAIVNTRANPHASPEKANAAHVLNVINTSRDRAIDIIMLYFSIRAPIYQATL